MHVRPVNRFLNRGVGARLLLPNDWPAAQKRSVGYRESAVHVTKRGQDHYGRAMRLAGDLRLMEASSICGASWLRGFARVYFPISLPGVLAACILTFTLSLGFYITPALLGSPRDMMIAQMIAGQFNEQLNFGLGAALAVVLMILTAVAFGLFGGIREWARRRQARKDKA